MNKEATIDIQQEITDLENERVMKSELPIKEKYLSALRSGDTEKINEYLESGAFPHSRITNRSNYDYALKAGFKAPFKLSGDWFEWPRINYKTISFKVNANDSLCNKIYYAKLPNGKWVSDKSHRTGYAGGGGTPSIFNKQHVSKEAAIRFALDSLKNTLQKGIKEAPHDTCGNYNVKYIKRVLSIISEYEAEQTEPTTSFAKETNALKEKYTQPDKKETDNEPIKTAKVDGLTQIVMPFEVEEVKQKRDPNAELFGYIAKDKTDRQRFKRKLERTIEWIKELPAPEAKAIIKAVSNLSTPPR